MLFYIQKYLDDVHVDGATFEELGFPVDVDECGTSVIQTAAIAQESRHRAKIITHAHQVELRVEWSANLKAETQRKKDDHMSVLEAQFWDNKNCKDKLRKLMKEDVQYTR